MCDAGRIRPEAGHRAIRSHRHDTGTRLGLPVAISPSGTPTLTAGRLAGLRDAGARAVSLSLDGSTAEVHDRFRGVPGVLGWTLDAWQAARELGLKVQVNTSVTGHNLTDLADIAALVHRLGAVSWSAFLLVPTGRGALPPALTARVPLPGLRPGRRPVRRGPLVLLPARHLPYPDDLAAMGLLPVA